MTPEVGENSTEEQIGSWKRDLATWTEDLSDAEKKRYVLITKLRLELTKALTYLDLVEEEAMEISELEQVVDTARTMVTRDYYTRYGDRNLYALNETIKSNRDNVEHAERKIEELMQVDD